MFNLKSEHLPNEIKKIKFIGSVFRSITKAVTLIASNHWVQKSTAIYVLKNKLLLFFEKDKKKMFIIIIAPVIKIFFEENKGRAD